jgi:hypothetical protein
MNLCHRVFHPFCQGQGAGRRSIGLRAGAAKRPGKTITTVPAAMSTPPILVALRPAAMVPVTSDCRSQGGGRRLPLFQNYDAQAPDGLFLVCIGHDGVTTWVRGDT